jgi:hypothetical protein
MNRHWAVFAGVALIAAMVFDGCIKTGKSSVSRNSKSHATSEDRRNRKSSVVPIYDVSIKNLTNSRIGDAEVKFDDGSWEFTFGNSNPGISKTYVGIVGMPLVPPSATVKWSTEAGDGKKKVVQIPESVRSMSEEHGELQFAIESGETVRVEFLKQQAP